MKKAISYQSATFLCASLTLIVPFSVCAGTASLQLQPTDALNADDQFGYAVAISEDANTAVVGAPRKEFNGNLYAGAAYVFVRSGSTWVQQAKLIGTGSSSEKFGFSVGISGNHILVGSDGSGAWMFGKSGATWTNQTMRFKDITVYRPSGHYGSAVAISGGTAIVGDYQWAATGSEKGAVLFYQEVNGEWLTSIGQLFTGLHNYEWYGYAVAAGGSHGVVGAPYESSGSSYPGAAWVYPEILPLAQEPLVNNACYGNSAAMTPDGLTAVLGAPYEDPNNTGGAAYVFYQGTTPSAWGKVARLTMAGGGYHDAFGSSCGISTGRIVVGAPSQDGLRGSVYYFTGSGATWAQQDIIYPTAPQSSDYFGYAVAIAGKTVVIGSPAINQTRGGKAFVFETPALPPVCSLACDAHGGQPRLGFESVLNQHYRVERSTTLLPGSWSAAVDNILGTGSHMEVADPTPLGTVAFYRLVVLP